MFTPNDKWFNIIGAKLRRENAALIQEQLPRRWVDLIHYLEEQEKRSETAKRENGHAVVGQFKF